MSEGHTTRKIVARGIVAVLLGLAMGYAVGTGLAHDAARGKALTMKEYIANFEKYRNNLIGSEISIWAAVVAGVLTVVVALAIYEVLVWVVDKLLTALDRRHADGPSGG